jgi:hypothetical protein
LAVASASVPLSFQNQAVGTVGQRADRLWQVAVGGARDSSWQPMNIDGNPVGPPVVGTEAICVVTLKWKSPP